MEESKTEKKTKKKTETVLHEFLILIIINRGVAQ